MGMEGEAGDGVEEDGLAQRRTLPCLSFHVHGCLIVNEGQRHELCEAAGALLESTEADEVAGDGIRPFYVPKHESAGCLEADRVCCFNHRQPLPRGELVRADNTPYLIVKHLSSCARQGAEAALLELKKVLANREL